MSACKAIIDHPRGVIITQRRDDLIKFRQIDCAAAIWQRDLLPELQTWLNQLPSQNLPQCRIIMSADNVSDTIHKICEQAETPNCTEREMLINDIVKLCEAFSSIMNTQHIRLRLENITDNACCKFHKDAITARLVCTYRGDGTQYGHAERDTQPNKVFDVPTGSPVLLRGKLWPEQPDQGLLHRSPPIEGTLKTRLLMVIDPISEAEAAT